MKCSKLGWCEAMGQALRRTAPNSEAKGLSIVYGWPAKATTGSATRLGVVYRERARAPGMMLNVCPWCAAEIHWWPQACEIPDVVTPPKRPDSL